MIPPRETVARVRPLMDRMGITRVANVTNLDVIGIPVVMVVRPNSRTNCVSQGKGTDLDAAKASGLMESVEAFHAERIQLPLRLASYERLRHEERTVEIRKLPRAKDSRFHKRLKLQWAEGRDILQNESIWLPYEVVHLNFCLPFPSGSGCFFRSSNGLASGNHILEAISHGLCEVVERDAAALWDLLGRRAQAKTRLDLDSVDDPACREILEKYERAKMFVAAWVVPSEVGIPAFRCSVFPRTAWGVHSVHPALGYGCHPDRGVALHRALTEAAQSRLTFITGSRDDLQKSDYDPRHIAEYLKEEETLLKSSTTMRRFSDVVSGSSRSIDEDVAWELECVRHAGFERVIVVDLTQPEVGLPVARVVIPGMEVSSLVPGQRARAFRRAHS
ncbi:MAG: YcaO-like family protein [Candidatus Acidiferrales bacterium]